MSGKKEEVAGAIAGWLLQHEACCHCHISEMLDSRG